jgi:hypothetical protein
MSNPINTIPIQQFIQQVKAADLSQQREIKMDIKTAKMLAYCINEINSRLLENYDVLFQKLMQSTGQSVAIQMDGGGFGQ